MAKTEAAPVDPIGVRRHGKKDKKLSQNPGEALGKPHKVGKIGCEPDTIRFLGDGRWQPT